MRRQAASDSRGAFPPRPPGSPRRPAHTGLRPRGARGGRGPHPAARAPCAPSSPEMRGCARLRAAPRLGPLPPLRTPVCQMGRAAAPRSNELRAGKVRTGARRPRRHRGLCARVLICHRGRGAPRPRGARGATGPARRGLCAAR